MGSFGLRFRNNPGCIFFGIGTRFRSDAGIFQALCDGFTTFFEQTLQRLYDPGAYHYKNDKKADDLNQQIA